MIRRRTALAAGAGALLAACTQRERNAIGGGFAGIDHERGHGLRQPWPERAPDATRRAHTLIVGGGIAGLAAARALRLAGHDDFVLLELEDDPGGNSRGMQLGGMACPMGAHYLPVPGDDAPLVQDWLEELGLRRRVAGRWQYDERHLCHSPQERLFFNGQWQEGLLPLQGVGAVTLDEYRRFADAVAREQKRAHYSIPLQEASFAPPALALDRIGFAAWLQAGGLGDAHLLWYLDYCCRDDYGAGIAQVSAWAGIHYFAARHGFQAPAALDADDAGHDAESAVLTWPEGNGWLAQRLAAPLGDRLRTGRVVGRIEHGRHGVTVDALAAGSGQLERWQAQQAVVALPVPVAARVLGPLPAAVRARANAVVQAPWLVGNLRLSAPLADRPGAASSWDNVLYGAPGLGYVDAMHQSLRPIPGPTVLSHYRALGGDPGARARLLELPWTHWRDTILAELSAAHPDLPAKTERIELVRYGHAMAIPLPGTLAQLGALRAGMRGAGAAAAGGVRALIFDDAPRLAFAHADWSGYSVFEEAFSLGHAAGQALA